MSQKVEYIEYTAYIGFTIKRYSIMKQDILIVILHVINFKLVAYSM